METGFFPFEEAIMMVTFMNFRDRIEKCLKTEGAPVYVEFKIKMKVDVCNIGMIQQRKGFSG